MVDISDEMTDMEMSNNDSSDGDKGVIVSEVNLTKRPPALQNNKDSSTRVRLTTKSQYTVCFWSGEIQQKYVQHLTRFFMSNL